MSIYDKATLVQIPSGYKASGAKLYSVLPANGDGDFTVSADADATRIDENGLIESTSANQARLSRNFIDGVVQPDPFLLLEPTRTQLAEYTNAISSANGYGLTNGTLTTDSHTAPDGSNEASTFEATSANGQFQKVKIGSSGVQYTVSAYVKRKTGTGTVYLRAVENTNTAVTVTDEWTRVSLTVTSTSTNIRYGMALATSGDEIYVWGFQVEAGSYATSLIPNTSTGQVTRTADDCTLTGFSDNLGQTEGVLFIDMDNFGQAGTSYGNFLKIYEDGDSTDRVIIQNSAEADNRIILVVRANSSTLFQPREDIPTGRNKIALKYKSGDIDVFLNGTKIETSSSTFTFANTLNKVQIGQPNKVYQAMIFNEALSDSELENLTSYDSFGQMAKALLYTIE